jgi:hypothetical protein
VWGGVGSELPSVAGIIHCHKLIAGGIELIDFEARPTIKYISRIANPRQSILRN